MLRHKEVEQLESDLEGNYQDPLFSLVFMSVTYDGFGLGFNNIAASAAFGLRIPLIPLYLVGFFTGSCYLLLAVRSTLADKALQRERVLAIERSIISKNHYGYWRSTLPGFQIQDKFQDLETIVKTHSAAEIADCLGKYYQRIATKRPTIDQLKAGVVKDSYLHLLNQLDLHFAAEVSQFHDVTLTKRLNKACATKVVPTPDPPAPSTFQIFRTNLRKYYKSSLSGAATAGGLTIFILTTSLSTATTTALFPWSLLGILFIAIVGGIAGYKIDKHFDRKHKINLQRINTSFLAMKNTRRLLDLFSNTIETLNEIERQEAIDNAAPLKISPSMSNKSSPLLVAQQTDATTEYIEVTQLRQQSQINRRLADYFLPTLIATRTGFSAVSSLFAGIGFAGLVLPLFPVLIIGGILLAVHIIFKIINNYLKHQRETLRTNNLNELITPQKFAYWQFRLTDFGHIENFVKQKTTQEIFEALSTEYIKFKAILSRFSSTSNKAADKTKDGLITLHRELLYLYRAHADSLNNKKQANQLSKNALYAPPQVNMPSKIQTFWTNLVYQLTPTATTVMNNFKDVVQGAAFGFGLSVTIFAFMGVTSLATITPIIIVAAATMVGIAIKLSIRLLIKAARKRYLNTIDGVAKSISDKEQLMDCIMATQKACEKAKSLIDECTSSHAGKPSESADAPRKQALNFNTSDHSSGFSKQSRPLLWIESSGKISDCSDEEDNRHQHSTRPDF